MAMIPMEYDQGGGNTLGSRVTLTDNTEYTCPSEGYFFITIPDSTTNIYCDGYVNSAQIMSLSTAITGGQLCSRQRSAVYVKQGMKIKYHGSAGNSNGYFYPIQ